MHVEFGVEGNSDHTHDKDNSDCPWIAETNGSSEVEREHSCTS